MHEKHVRLLSAALLIILVLFPSCSVDRGENAGQGKTGEREKIELLSSSYTVKEYPLPLRADEKILYIQPTGEGYLCLIQGKGTSRYLRLNSDFEETESESPEETNAVAFLETIEGRYTIAKSKEAPQTMDLFREEETYAAIHAPYSGRFTCQMIWEGDVLYSVIDGSYLTVGAKVIRKPEDTADGRRYWLIGLFDLPDGIHLLLSETRDIGEETHAERVVTVPVDPSLKEIPTDGKEISTLFSEGLCATDGQYGYLLTGSNLYRSDGDKWGKLVSLSELGVDAFSVRSFAILADGRFLFADETSLTELRPKEGENLQKQEIVIGVVDDFEESMVNDAVLRFNRDQDRYTVSVKSFQGDQERMNLALLSGELSLIYVPSHPEWMRAYARQGLIVSLEEAAPELFEEGYLMKNVVDACRTNGVCYFLPRSFSVSLLTLGKEYMGERTGFSGIDEIVDFLRQSDSVLLRAQYRFSLSNYLIRNLLDEWIDWEKGEAHFDEESFQRIIELAKQGGEDVTQADRLNDSIGYGALGEYVLHEVPSPVGILTDDKAKSNKAKVLFSVPVGRMQGAPLEGDGYWAIAHPEETQKGAAEFMRYLFAMQEKSGNWKHFQGKEMYMPVVRSALEEHLKIKVNPQDELTQMTWDFVSGADHLQYGVLVEQIIEEELGAFFRGGITAKQAAEYVQNRVSIYLAEQG